MRYMMLLLFDSLKIESITWSILSYHVYHDNINCHVKMSSKNGRQMANYPSPVIADRLTLTAHHSSKKQHRQHACDAEIISDTINI